MAKTYAYSAQDNLETMLDAVNYNRFQRDFIYKEVQKIPKKTKRVLDFGAGIGTYADMVQDLGQKVDCAELDKNHIKILKKKGYEVYPELSKAKQKYDVIYSLNVLEHIEDDEAALATIKSALAKTGRVVIFVPAFRSIWTGLDDKAEHLRRYRIGDFKKLCQATGLEIENIKYCDQVGFAGAVVYKLIGGSGTLTPRSVHIFDTYLFPINKILEPLFGKLFGKNILAVLTLPKKK